jgi:hypothetical protein
VIDFATAFGVLSRAGVEYIVVGGTAATIHGSARLTRDLDIVYRRTPDNLRRLVAALSPHGPYLRGAPPGLPFQWDEDTLKRGLNFTLTTSLGDIDLLGEVAGGGAYDALLPHCATVKVFGVECLCPNLDMLIRVKRAAGRPKDLEAVAELETLREEKGG